MAAPAFPFWALICIVVGVGMIIWYRRRADDGGASGTKSSAPDAFAQDAIDVMSAANPDYHYGYNHIRETIIGFDPNGEEQHTLALANLRQRTAEMGRADRVAYLQNFAAQIESPELTPDDAARLRLRARTASERQLRAQYSSLRGQGEPTDHLDDIALTPVGKELIGAQIGDMLLQPMIDGDNTLRSLGEDDLERLELTLDQVMERARRNLFEDLPPVEQLWEQVSEHIFIMATQTDFEVAQLVALGDMVPTPQRPLDQLVCYFPAHAVCMVATDRNEAVLEEMIEVGTEMASTQRPFSAALWELAEDGWAVFDPQDPPSAAARLAHAQARAGDHEEQTQSLKRMIERAGLDIHAASLIAFQKDTGDILTTAVFIGGGCLLPVVDEIRWPQDGGMGSAPDKDAPMLIVAWGDFARIMGLDGEPSYQGLLPTRYYFEHDPTPDQAVALHRAGRVETST